MINRRLLRIKVMQAMYALREAQASHYQSAVDYINDYFNPDYSKLDKEEIDKILQSKDEHLKLLTKTFQENKFTQLGKDPDVDEAIVKAANLYEKDRQSDIARVRKVMIGEVEGVLQTYYLMINFLVELADYIPLYAERQKEKKIITQPIPDKELKLFNNRLIEMFRSDEALKNNLSQPSASWDLERERVYTFFRKVVLKDELYQKYAQKESTTFEEDKEVLLLIVKNLLFKDKDLLTYFEDQDLYWNENSSVLKSLLTKMVKSIEQDTKKIPEVILSTDWKEDKKFFVDLFDETVKHELDNQHIIVDRLKNWDLERVALIDNIILSLAITEMLYFSSIPLKVTINEYIDISKRYSTPKSKQFINGVLDKASEELNKKGLIKKSGRGLIDNK